MGGISVRSSKRLHIKPFTPELIDKIIAPSLKPFATDISFHTKPAFPDQGFGYVVLPEMEAEKLKKKLNGSTLKGTKVRIEDAKPEKKRKSDDEDGTEGRKARKVAKRDKQKREDGVLPGHELEEGRHVKRGWTDESESKTSKARGKSSKGKETQDSSEGKKLRFKTIVPPNATTTKDAPVKKKGKEGKSDKKVVVEEFKKTKKSLVTSGGDEDAGHGELTYEDGRGWIDQDGNVVEAERATTRSRRGIVSGQSEPNVSAIESTENKNLSDADDMAVDAETVESRTLDTNVPAAPDTTAEPSKDVHPLEALFKRPTSGSTISARARPQPIDTSFSFFDATAGGGDAEMDDAVPPKTPNTKRDLEWRSIRSAAPTPDTAAIGRKFSFPFASGEDDEEDVSEEGDDAEMEDANQAKMGASQGSGQAPGEESAFRKWFYEHRGEFNRGWKKRRREEKKAKRQRENRRLRSRVA